MLDNKDNPFEAYTVNTPVAGKGVGGRSGFLKERVFDQIPKKEMLKFVDNDVENVLNEYLTNAALLQKREQFFGRSLDVFKTRYVEKIEAELRAAGASRADIKNYVTDPLATMYERVSGINVPVFGSKYGKGIADGVKLSQQLAHLPLATISSLTEPMILLSRVDAKDAPAAAKTLVLLYIKKVKK